MNTTIGSKRKSIFRTSVFSNACLSSELSILTSSGASLFRLAVALVAVGSSVLPIGEVPSSSTYLMPSTCFVSSPREAILAQQQY